MVLDETACSFSSGVCYDSRAATLSKSSPLEHSVQSSILFAKIELLDLEQQHLERLSQYVGAGQWREKISTS